jgi:hypothetical protein
MRMVRASGRVFRLWASASFAAGSRSSFAALRPRSLKMAFGPPVAVASSPAFRRRSAFHLGHLETECLQCRRQSSLEYGAAPQPSGVTKMAWIFSTPDPAERSVIPRDAHFFEPIFRTAARGALGKRSLLRACGARAPARRWRGHRAPRAHPACTGSLPLRRRSPSSARRRRRLSAMASPRSR